MSVPDPAATIMMSDYDMSFVYSTSMERHESVE